MSDIQLRPATPADAPRLAALGAQVWLDTYATEGVSETIAAFVLAEFTAARMAALLAEPAVTVWVAESAGHLVGHATVRAGVPCAADAGATVELVTLYVQAPFKGRGIGARLLAQAEQIAAQAAPAGSALWLTVYAGNAAALAFYTRCGYRRVGSDWFVLGEARHENTVLVSPP